MITRVRELEIFPWEQNVPTFINLYHFNHTGDSIKDIKVVEVKD